MSRFLNLILFILFLLITITATSQERVNRPKLTLGASLGKLTTATGWTLNTDERWINRQNRIPCDFSGQAAKMIDYEKYKLGFDNFIYYQFRKASYKGDSLILLVKKYRDGEYYYEHIERDWMDYFNCMYVAFDPKDVKDFVLENDTTITMGIPLKTYGYTGRINETQSESLMISNDYTPSAVSSDGALYINYHIFKQKKVVRFSIFYISGAYSWPDGFNTKLVDDQFPDSKLLPFDKCYYETSYDSFYNFISFLLKKK